MAFTKWMMAATTAMTTTMVAGSALALSCLPPSIEGAFKGWADAPERYFIVAGSLTAVSPLPPIPSPGVPNPGTDTPDLRAVYRVQGEDVRGFTSLPIDHYIWVRVGCAGPWCGQFPTTGTSGVMGLKQLPDGTLELGIGACPGSIFDDSAKARVQQCMTSGCTPPVPNR